MKLRLRMTRDDQRLGLIVIALFMLAALLTAIQAYLRVS